MPELPFWARIETLWLLFVPLCALVYALLQPLAPNDLWYHVRAGELLSQLGHIPTTNAMSSGVPLDTPFYYQSWLAEYALYQTISHFGLSGLQWLRALCLCLTFCLLIAAGLRWAKRDELAFGSGVRALAAGSLWAFLISSNNVDLRPQTFSVLLCALWVWLLLELWRAPSVKVGLALCVVAGVWANTHGAFVLAPASLFVLSMAHGFSRRAKTFWALTLAVVLATLINPRGPGLYVYLASLSNNTIGQKYIQEWRSPGFDEWHSILFWLSPLLIALLWRAAKAPKAWLVWLAPVGLSFLMGARDQRAMIWFALFSAPLLGVLIARLIPAPKPQLVPRAAQFINGVLLVILCSSALLFSPNIKTLLPWPDEFKNRFAPTPQSVFPGQPDLLLERTTPTSAVEWWHKNPQWTGSKVWTDMVPGSFLTWATRRQVNGGRAIVPLCDPRIELFPDSFWENYVRLSNGPGDAHRELGKGRFAQALLDVETQAGLVRELKRDGWKVVARNGSTVLLVGPFFVPRVSEAMNTNS